MDVFILDACALIAFLRKDKGYEKIITIFDKATNLEVKVIMHAATLSEVYYDFVRFSTKVIADNVISDLNALPVDIIKVISMEIIEQIGYFKTTYKISFADSIVLSTAKLNNTKVVTSDHHEFDEIEKGGDMSFEWIR